MLLEAGLKKESIKVEGQPKTSTYRTLPPALVPVKVAIFPLVKNDGLPEKAYKLAEALRPSFNLVCEENQPIGKRYARQDLIGTPYCITVDHQTLEDNTVTLRERDSMQQERIPIDALHGLLMEQVGIATLLKQLTLHPIPGN